MTLTLSGWRAAAAVVALALATSMVGALAPATRAAFVTTTANPGNSWTSATLQAPTGFTATCVDSGRVDLSWTASPTSAVTGYRIDRRRDDETEFTYLATASGQATESYSDTDEPFPSGLLSVLGTLTVEYELRAEIAGTNWVSTHAGASTSGSVTSVLGVAVFSCN